MRKALFLILTVLVLWAPVHAAWDLSNHSIPVDQIRGGGPPKDGIPALFNPEYLPVMEADRLLKPEEQVLGMTINGVARAYPVRIMSYHELVNDVAGDSPYLVSW